MTKKTMLILKMALMAIIIYMSYLCLDVGKSYSFGYSSFEDWYNNGFWSASRGQKVPAWSSPNYAGWACWDGATGTYGSTYTVNNIYDISTNSSNSSIRALTIGIADLSEGRTTGCPEPETAIAYMWNQCGYGHISNQTDGTGVYATWIESCRKRGNAASSSSGDLKKSGSTTPKVVGTNGNYKCIGPFRVSYGSSGVDGVRVNGSSSRSYYSLGTTQSAFNSKKLVSSYGVPNGQNFYLWIPKSDLGSGDSASVTFVQTYSYYTARLVFLTGNSLQDCMAYRGRSSTGTKTVSYSFKLGAELTIRKKDGWTLDGSNKYVSGYQVTVYNSSTNRYYDASGNEYTYAKSVTVSSSSGLTITGLPGGNYTVTEVGAPKNYNLNKQINPPQSEGASKTIYKKSISLPESGNGTVVLQNVKYTDIVIIKKDSRRKTPESGLYFTIQDDRTKKYIAADGSRTSSPVQLVIGSDGKIVIKDILVPYDGTTFTIKEVKSDNLYYYIPPGGYTFIIKAANNYDGTVSYVQTQSGDKAYSSGGVLYNVGAYSFTIQKLDKENGKPVNATFNIQYEDGTWLTSNCEYSSSRSPITTPGGIANLQGVKKGTYHIYEVGIGSGYKLELQDGYDPSNKWIDCGTITVNDNKKTASVTFYNKKYTNLEIRKVDTDTGQGIEGIGFTIYDNHYGKYIDANGEKTSTPVVLYTDENGLIRIENILLYDEGSTFTVSEIESRNLYYKTDTSIKGTISGQGNGTVEWSSTTIKNTRPYYLTVEKVDPDMRSEQLTAYFYIQYQDGTWLTQSGEYSSSPSSITITSSGTIPKIKRGIYHIYEYKTPIGYDPVQQDGYGKDSSHPDWIDCGTAYVGIDGSGAQDNSVCKVTVSKDNKKYISKITGYVWIDNKDGKANEFDYVYNSSSADQKLSGIKVEFMTTKGDVISTTTTGSDGSYAFSFYKQILYWDLQNYMIRFTYDNGTYTVVPINVEASATNASRAIEKHDWENDKLATGTGIATSIQNSASLDESIAKYYNVNNYCVEGINLGLLRKPYEEFSIIENLDHVKLVKGNYTFTYEYGKDAVVQDVPEREYIYETVALQNSARSFTQKLYPSDIAYNNTATSNKFEVYVVYKISITNTMNINLSDLYVEKSLNITSLASTYNTNIYQLSDSNWQETGSGQAKYNNTINAIVTGNSEEVSIQFKVTESGLQELIQGGKTNPEFYKECATTAIADGYHKYNRNDYSWTYSKNSYRKQNEHQTKGETRESSALSLKLTLAEQRTISGIVFEDTQTAESAEEHTRLGNGVYDENEKKIKAVTVELLNKEDETIASLYSIEGDYLKQESNGVWTFNKQEAITEVKEDGTYALKGVIPGEYYLQFTYSNGSKIITDTEGTPLDLALYKSTILTGFAANISNGDWYLEAMKGNNSIATDKYYINKDGTQKEDVIEKRMTSTEELNYSSQNNFNEGKIQAISPSMNIQFEYLKEQNKEHDYNFIPDCSGMSFGIIERPHTELVLNKKIKNVKITLANGSTIINGNPQTANTSQYLTSFSDKYAKVEMDNSILYGSSLSITYDIVATNESELDYATREFYEKGTIDSNTLVKNKITKIIDYLSSKNGNYTASSENIKLAETFDRETYFEPNLDNSEYKEQLLETLDDEIELSSIYANSGESSTTYSLTVSRLLSTDEDDLGLESYSEIIGFTNVTFTPQYSSHSGNYKAGDMETFPVGTSEPDNAYITMAVIPSTGENRSYTIYIIAGTMLIVLTGGIIIIKKFVL